MRFWAFRWKTMGDCQKTIPQGNDFMFRLKGYKLLLCLFYSRIFVGVLLGVLNVFQGVSTNSLGRCLDSQS